MEATIQQIINEKYEHYSPSPFVDTEIVIDKEKFIEIEEVIKDSPIPFDERKKVIERLVPLLNYDLFNAMRLESGIYQHNRIYCFENKIHTNLVMSVYMDRLNEIIRNLDPSNSVNNLTLFDGIVYGGVDAVRVPFMSPEELHPKRWEHEIQKKEYRDNMANNMETTDRYKCRECGARKSIVTQMQTRSADEPMTTFVTCVECAHVLRF